MRNGVGRVAASAGVGWAFLTATAHALAPPGGGLHGGGAVLAARQPVGFFHAAGPPPSLRDFMFGAGPGSDRRFGSAPAIARYNADSDGFVLDRAAKVPLLRFDDSPEIFALFPTPGPRGDTIYKNDAGEPVLRVSRLGGVTLFTDDQPMGAAAYVVGQAAALHPALPLGPNGLFNVLAEASRRASRAAQHLILFDAPETTQSSEGVFADAFAIAADAFVRMGAAGGRGRAVITRVMEVSFLPGHAPDVLGGGARVEIVVAPDLGVAGRPSSERILAVLER
ncbi:MAG: DUF4908 domain-containing protein [Caulobacteraceae bacterium]|nr:DUF4908 domain-containing protein [Caulobacter sp.]